MLTSTATRSALMRYVDGQPFELTSAQMTMEQAVARRMSAEHVEKSKRLNSQGNGRWTQALQFGLVKPGEALGPIKLNQSWLAFSEEVGAQPVFISREEMNLVKGSYLAKYDAPNFELLLAIGPGAVIKEITVVDRTFGKSALVDSYKGTGLGSSEAILLEKLGPSLRKSSENTRNCLLTLGSPSSTIHFYSGVSFIVCKANQQVIAMSIRAA